MSLHACAVKVPSASWGQHFESASLTPVALKPGSMPLELVAFIKSKSTVWTVGDQIRAMKHKLKAEGLSGNEINDHGSMKLLVIQLQQLYKAQSAAVYAPPLGERRHHLQSVGATCEVLAPPCLPACCSAKSTGEIPTNCTRVPPTHACVPAGIATVTFTQTALAFKPPSTNAMANSTAVSGDSLIQSRPVAEITIQEVEPLPTPKCTGKVETRESLRERLSFVLDLPKVEKEKWIDR